MVISYWDMACSLVNNGAIDAEMFNDANGEHMFVYAKMEPFLPALREDDGQSNTFSRTWKRSSRNVRITKPSSRTSRDRMQKLIALYQAARGCTGSRLGRLEQEHGAACRNAG